MIIEMTSKGAKINMVSIDDQGFKFVVEDESYEDFLRLLVDVYPDLDPDDPDREIKELTRELSDAAHGVYAASIC